MRWFVGFTCTCLAVWKKLETRGTKYEFDFDFSNAIMAIEANLKIRSTLIGIQIKKSLV